MGSDLTRVSNVTYICVCGVLYSQRLCDGPIRRPGSPNKCLASRQIPNLNRLDSRRLIFSEVNSELNPARVKYVKVVEEEDEEEEEEEGGGGGGGGGGEEEEEEEDEGEEESGERQQQKEKTA